MGISTAIPQGSIAAGVGIETKNQNFGGAISKLNTRIAVLAQPRKGIVPSVKGFAYDLPVGITSPGDAADKFGFGGPVHLAALRLYNSKQSVGTIPVDVYPIQESTSGRSQGTLTIDDVVSDGDTITIDAKTYIFQTTLTNVDGNIFIGADFAASQVNLIAAINLSGTPGVQYAGLMTIHPTVEIADFSANNAILTALDSGVSGDTIVTTETLTAVTNVFDAVTLGTTQAGAETTALGSISFSGTQTITQDYTLKIGSEIMRFTLSKGETAAQVATKVKDILDSNVKLPITAGTISGDSIPLTANWAGITGNEIGIEIEGLFQGIVMSISAMIGGVGNPSVINSINNFQIFYSDVVNGIGDTASKDALEIRNEQLWAALEARPYLAYSGSNETDPTLVSADTDTRLNDRTNVLFPIPGSPSLNIDIAASIVALVALTKNSDPAKPYFETPIYGVTAGNAQVVQWDYAQRDFIEKRGCSTSFINNGLIFVGDVLTTFHPAGEDFPGYRYAVDVSKIQLQLTDIRKLFTNETWVASILVGDDDEVSNPNARKPSDAKGDIFGLIDRWANAAIVKDRDFLKQNTKVEIDPLNANRLNIVVPSILSGSTRIRSVDLVFSTEVGGN